MNLKKLLIAFGGSLVYLFSHRKMLIALLFALTVGNQFAIPEWLTIVLELISGFTILILMLKNP